MVNSAPRSPTPVGYPVGGKRNHGLFYALCESAAKEEDSVVADEVGVSVVPRTVEGRKQDWNQKRGNSPDRADKGEPKNVPRPLYEQWF